MGLARMTPEQLELHLSELGVLRGMDVVVHSGLVAFGQFVGGVEAIFSTLMEYLGDRSTVVFPSYTFNLGAGDIYEPHLSPPFRVGLLSEYAAAQPHRRRGMCPIHNHVYFGCREIQTGARDVSFGVGSSFDFLVDGGFYLLLLGIGLHEGGTVVHHFEAEATVPYREWIELPRQIGYSDGTVQGVNVKYFARKRDTDHWQLNLRPLQFEALAQGLMNRSNLPHGASHMISLADLRRITMERLSRDPYGLVS